MQRRVSLRYFPVVFFLLFLTGCAARLPQTIPVSQTQKDDILAHYLDSRSRDCDFPVDADVILDIRSFGRKMMVDGYLQIQPPSFVRATVLDKVGRPLFILVAKGDELTFVDSMKGKALIGPVGSLIRNNDFPVRMETGEFAALLIGRFFPDELLLQDIRTEEKTKRSAWLVFSAPGGNLNRILFDFSAERIIRHAVENREGDILLDIRYEWNDEIKDQCSPPSTLSVSGEVLDGEVELLYTRVMRPEQISPDVFELSLPDHYRIRHAE